MRTFRNCITNTSEVSNVRAKQYFASLSHLLTKVSSTNIYSQTHVIDLDSMLSQETCKLRGIVFKSYFQRFSWQRSSCITCVRLIDFTCELLLIVIRTLLVVKEEHKTSQLSFLSFKLETSSLTKPTEKLLFHTVAMTKIIKMGVRDVCKEIQPFKFY